jgi:hypothetical protein
MKTSNNLIIVDSSGRISLVANSDSSPTTTGTVANQYVGTQDNALVPAEVFAGSLNILGKSWHCCVLA